MSEVTGKIITPPPKPEPDTRRVVLEMPYDVAVTLYSMVIKIAGCDTTTYRKHTDMIARGLYRVGIAPERRRLSGTLEGNRIDTSTE